jgi:hypothetical protein
MFCANEHGICRLHQTTIDLLHGTEGKEIAITRVSSKKSGKAGAVRLRFKESLED